ncbi:MAG: Gldg family protein [Planctomycetes bacterium]|jgi:hypothetical protein|nr:Gldg family protein [Planctomycetota bacterium]
MSWKNRIGKLGGRTLLVLAVLAIVVAAADRSKLFVDWSADHRFSLSPALVTLLEQQQEAVELVSIWPLEVDSVAQPIADGLRLMAERSAKIVYRHIDPVLHKPTLAEFEKRYREASVGVYVVRPATGRAFRIPLNNSTRQVLQRDVGGALVALADPHPPTISLLQGHGELRPGGGDEDGGDQLIRALELAGFVVTPVELARGGRIAAESLLLIPGPVAPLGPDLELVRAHLADGGATLALVDDRAPLDLSLVLRARGVLCSAALPADLRQAMTPSGDLVAALGPQGANLPPRVVVSLRHHAVGQEAAFPHHNLLLDGDLLNPDHPVTARAASSGQSVVSPWTSPVQLLQPGTLPEEVGKRLQAAYTSLGTVPFVALPLLQSAPADAWTKARGEPFQVPDTLAKQSTLPLAWAIESMQTDASVRDDRGARLVVWGSRQAASDGVLGQGRFANADLLVDAARWLLRRERATAIPEAESSAFRVDASDGLLFWLSALLVAAIPCACIGVAILTWWDRR